MTVIRVASTNLRSRLGINLLEIMNTATGRKRNQRTRISNLPR